MLSTFVSSSLIPLRPAVFETFRLHLSHYSDQPLEGVHPTDENQLSPCLLS
jgi:hypothetical protein